MYPRGGVADTAAETIISLYADTFGNGTITQNDAITSTPWTIKTDTHTENGNTVVNYRYVGKNPDNYVTFNGELWRIIGVFPTEVCTNASCSTTETQNLIKIIRNASLGSFSWDYKQTGVGSSTSKYGSNDWSDSQLMMMLNKTAYLNTGYTASGTLSHSGSLLYQSGEYILEKASSSGTAYYVYRNMGSYLDSSKTTYSTARTTTSNATSSYPGGTTTITKLTSDTDKIATVKWNLYGTKSYATAAEGSPLAFYEKERNINSRGAVYTGAGTRPTYWYGQIGLMYPSDYGYATYGNEDSSPTRDTCLGYNMSSWNSGDYITYCAGNSWLWYNNVTSSNPSSGTAQWTISPYSGGASNVFIVYGTGYVSGYSASNSFVVRPVLYLGASTKISSNCGTYDYPCTLS